MNEKAVGSVHWSFWLIGAVMLIWNVNKGSSLLLTNNATSPIEPSLARPLRIKYPGACYHMMNRGLVCSDLFLDDSDRQRFLEIGVRQTL